MKKPPACAGGFFVCYSGVDVAIQPLQVVLHRPGSPFDEPLSQVSVISVYPLPQMTVGVVGGVYVPPVVPPVVPLVDVAVDVVYPSPYPPVLPLVLMVVEGVFVFTVLTVSLVVFVFTTVLTVRVDDKPIAAAATNPAAPMAAMAMVRVDTFVFVNVSIGQ